MLQQEAVGEPTVERPERPDECGTPNVARRVPQNRVDHEEGHYPSVAVGAGAGDGLEEGGIVPETQVAAEPQDGGHDSAA